MKKKLAVILSGCGVFDGSEIHEATLTLLAIAKNGADYQAFAPDISQHHVLNHITGEEMQETRNVLVESARIARGQIKELSEFKAKDFDGLVLPGGFGAAKNLSNFAFEGAGMQVEESIRKALKETHSLGKPIGALCIAPVILAKLFDDAKVTIGQDDGTTEAINQLGAQHEQTSHGEITIDKENKLVTTPCYMLDATIVQVAEGADRLVKAVLEM